MMAPSTPIPAELRAKVAPVLARELARLRAEREQAEPEAPRDEVVAS